jgi:hypothetical protein
MICRRLLTAFLAAIPLSIATAALAERGLNAQDPSGDAIGVNIVLYAMTH